MASATVYVTGLPSATTQDDVMDFFTRIGNVAAVEMPTEASATSAIAVVFDKAEDAAAALTVSGSDFQDNVPVIISAEPPSAPAAAVEAAPASANPPAAPATAAVAAPATGSDANRPTVRRSDQKNTKNKVLVTNVPRAATRDELRAILIQCGPMDDFYFSPPAGRAIVGFTTDEGYEKALLLDNTQVQGVSISVKPRVLSDSSEHGRRRGTSEAEAMEHRRRRVVVENVSEHTSREAIREFFGPDCGMPGDLFIRQETREAFMEFPTLEGMEKAIAKSGQMLCGNAIKVTPRPIITCRVCGKSGHKAASCPQGGRGTVSRRGERGGRDSRGGGDRRRRRSSSSDRDYRSRHRRDRSDSLDRRRRRRHSRSRSPPRRRRHSRSRSPPRRRH